MILTLYLSEALLCLSAVCTPVLIGADTPVGTFHLRPRLTHDAGYGGSVIVFNEDARVLYAIHRVPTHLPNRHALLQSPDPADNTTTNGCVNVDDGTYDRLWAQLMSGASIDIIITSKRRNDNGQTPTRS